MDGSEDNLFGQMEEEIDENEREIVDIDSDSADELEEEELDPGGA
ncbi:7595_t:CDS:2 [Paraglomus brasilianum]|uniref:7595_t:CDS:1 n=1 Tax=Paraglomus brasilianum TaxID=144538 RepID=A0A9N9G0B0_9GLOM|nr:7595_t:CDS:2 [Paraglomus brasilianum]